MNEREYFFSFVFIFFTITVANLHHVFGLDILLQDASSGYLAFVNSRFFPDASTHFIGPCRLLKWLFSYLIDTHSIQQALFCMLVGFMVPLSGLLYLFNRKYLGLGVWVSLASAVIINIVPKQYLIPAFIGGSYPVQGILANVAAVIFTGQYLLKNPESAASWARK